MPHLPQGSGFGRHLHCQWATAAARNQGWIQEGNATSLLQMATPTDKLGAAHWELWQQAMAKCFLGHLEDHRLANALGEWNLTAVPHWLWMVSVRQAQVFQRCSTGWQLFEVTRGGTRQESIFQTSGTRVGILPPGRRPADVIATGLQPNHIKLNSWAQQPTHQPAPPPRAMTLQERLQQLPPEAGWSVEEVKQFQECEDDGRDVAQALCERK
jgi:hypothetical protein